MPSLNAVMSDVLQLDYTKLAQLRGGPLSVIGNLPYHITSQVRTVCVALHCTARHCVHQTLAIDVAAPAAPAPRH